MSLSERNMERMKAVNFNDVIEGMEESKLFDRLADLCLQRMEVEFNIEDDDDCQLHLWLTDVIERGAIEHLVKELADKGLDKSS
ncbi:hypothetical protein [Halomonas sp. AOP35-4E-18]|uniref:hypothetical protein n=1 Tax=Halomonas sp. AOP35-4E-18 TaxID=3457686 RepID=UPI004033E8AA